VSEFDDRRRLSRRLRSQGQMRTGVDFEQLGFDRLGGQARALEAIGQMRTPTDSPPGVTRKTVASLHPATKSNETRLAGRS